MKERQIQPPEICIVLLIFLCFFALLTKSSGCLYMQHKSRCDRAV